MRFVGHSKARLILRSLSNERNKYGGRKDRCRNFRLCSVPRLDQDDFGTAQLSGNGGARDSSSCSSEKKRKRNIELSNLNSLLTLSLYEFTNWTGIGFCPIVLITMASSLRILVPVKRVIDFAVRWSNALF